MPDEARAYAVVNAAFNPGQIDEAAWIALFGAAKQYPLAQSILSAARAAQEFITHDKRSQSPDHRLLNTMLGFEVNRDDVAAIQVVLDEQAVIRGVAGSNKDKFEGVLQGELRDGALDLGYSQVNADKLSVVLINADVPGTFIRVNAIAQAQAYLAANSGIWYDPEES